MSFVQIKVHIDGDDAELDVIIKEGDWDRDATHKELFDKAVARTREAMERMS